MNEFNTIVENVTAEIIEKKSKFIANLVKVESQEEAENKIKEIKKKYYDARHNCIAYRVYELDDLIERASDDGEPSGTAGGPMLNILRNQNLSNILVIVTRYFGGILLGTGGLVRAYSDSTIKAINSAKIIKKVMGIQIKVTIDYAQLENFKYYCHKNNFSIINIEYTENIVCVFTLDEKLKDKFMNDFVKKKVILKDIKILDKKIIDKCI